ncbi:acetoacetate decarboxylase family protein [Luteolibacter arcticus]|uniref:Acetoacetate decarboxylase family protein n=1 Tax=Luteolibacter arcticus TaxID=1581411 RepID=A0ABT3GPM9_9BACT|nr:acetoacetate decarboxylase family protein [Luteolibacter arcticus]MCW1925474.1 acetoacetate decarboxylase family protein [Luteolibacter arcticus]
MIPYTERDTDLNFRPPYRITGVEALSAVRRIDIHAAQQWLDETLNWRPDDEEPKPEFTALPLAFVIFMHMKSMCSIDPPHDAWGAASETEVVVTLPVLEWDNEGLPSPPSLKFYPIVLCLDSGPALISGREVFGFPKIVGKVEIGPDGGTARTEACRKEGEATIDRDALLLALRREKDDGQPALEPDSYGKGLAEMVKEELLGGLDRGVLGHLLKLNPARKALNFTLERVVDAIEGLEIGQKFVFLKQFRDVANPRVACHRSVAECVLEFSTLTSLRRESGDWELEVPEWHSSRLLKRIGLVSGPIGAPLRSEFQIDMSLGKTLWTS